MRIIAILMSILLSACVSGCVSVDGYYVLGTKKPKKKRTYIKRHYKSKKKENKGRATPSTVIIFDSAADHPLHVLPDPTPKKLPVP